MERQQPSKGDCDTQINIYVDQDTNILLEKSIQRSHRTKRQEASLRISDHLHRFAFGEFTSVRMDYDEKVTHINIRIGKAENELLMKSVDSYATTSITKREESSIRLRDHLLRFKGIAYIGETVEN